MNIADIISQEVKHFITSNLDSFISKLSEKYSLNKDELNTLLLETYPSDKYKKIEAVKENQVTVDRDQVTNPKTTKTELINICMSLKLTKTGNKEELVKRILASLDKNTKLPTPKNETKESSEVIGFVACTAAVKELPKRGDIKEYIKNQTKAIDIPMNKFGHYEHKETGLVLNDDKLVIGTQQPDGTISKLTDADIELCKKYTFNYKLPNNLNTKNTTDDYKVEELDESDLEEEEEEEPEEIEEEDL
jgi:hypothetical protein